MSGEIVGYKRPPVSTQFKPGQSGNPRGRPRRHRETQLEHIGTVIVSEMNEMIEVMENGKKIKVTKLRLVFKQLMAKAAKGDLAASRMLMNLIQKFGDKKEVEKYKDIETTEVDFSTPESAYAAWQLAQRLDELAGP